ncbi:MAG TPA: penicillin-binding protein 1C [Pseudomonadales bacterium]|nr:penicillin-binding protein 1C [Pseudomonadales bacterium]
MKRKAGALLLVVIAILCGARWWPHSSFREQLPTSQQVLASDGSLLRITLAADQQYRIWTPLSDIAPAMVQAILLKEDRYFYRHPGVNPVALLRAAWMSYVGGDQQGASTVTMQLARRWYQLNTRSPVGKLKQIAAAVWLELRYSKQDILEAYLNVVPMGGNIEGIGTGSVIYFSRPAKDLSLVESLALAVLPQDPVRRSNFGAGLQKSRQQLADKWRATYSVDAQTSALLDLPVKARLRTALPFRAPHLAEQLLAAYPQQAVINTNIDINLQTLLENQLQAYVRENGNRNIHNATALLVDTRDMSVKALVGSANYFDAAIAGQVNGVLAKRSPGSTLKPFLYGLAIDQGLIHPMSILKDAPTAFGPFQPENFDGAFVGPIHAQDALIRSRNIPAVSLAMQLHHPSLYGFLKHAGVSRLLSEDHYGLALTLGGGEVTMEELVTLYSLLANKGELHQLRYLQDEKTPEKGTALLSPEAAFLVIDMLQRNQRPDQFIQNKFSTTANHQQWKTAWKTGTSWGFRDAWTAGLVGHYALAVWIGNFDGKSNPAFVGIDSAAPLFFRIADALPLNLPHDSDRANTPPRTLKKIAVCEASGDLPNNWCPKTVDTWFIPGKSPIRVSTLHRPVVIDTRTGLAACPPFDSATTRTDIYEFWSSEIFQQFQIAGIPRRQPPATSNACTSLTAGDERDYPVINQPLAGVTYTLRMSRSDETIPLQARVAADVQQVFWFADAVFIGTAKPQESLAWRPQQSGTYNAMAVDDHGRSVSRPLTVEFVP